MDDAELKALLDGTTPGPWKLRKAYLDDDAVEIVPRKVRGKASPEAGSWAELATVQIEYTDSTPKANARLIAAAPDLALALLDARAENARPRADAQAAVALVLEQAAERLDLAEHDAEERDWRSGANAFAALAKGVRALAPADGLAAVEALRAERDAALAANRGLVRLNERTEADRDRLAAELAAAKQREARDAAQSFDEADWFWRTMDPDDCGDSPEEAINRAMVGQFCVCEIASSFSGPTRYGFVAPVLDPESDDEEFVHFATQQEAIDAAKTRAALAHNGRGE